jgi:nucleoside-diphosphate-sugar epimerase
MNDKRLFSFGYGYTCDFVARALQAAGGWTLGGTTRDLKKRHTLRSRGINAYLFDNDTPLGDPAMMLEGVTHLLISTPPGAEGDLAFQMHADDIVRLKSLQWVGYFSTTGVYGDREGGWVDEDSETRPSTIRGTRRAMAENQWLSLFKARGLPVHIFRLAGIYGPGRSALDSVRAGVSRRILKPGHAFSRVHVEDIAGAVIASFEKGTPGRVYNVVDDEAAPSHEVLAYAARLLGKEPAPLVRFEDANLAPITLSFYSDNKRVKNTRIKEELEVSLKYPNYRMGLEGCLAVEKEYEQRGETPPWAELVGDQTVVQI